MIIVAIVGGPLHGLVRPNGTAFWKEVARRTYEGYSDVVLDSLAKIETHGGQRVGFYNPSKLSQEAFELAKLSIDLDKEAT